MDGGSGIIKLGPFGNSPYGKPWDGKGHSNIMQIFVSHSRTSINSIQYQYVENGNLVMSELHGKLCAEKFDVVKLDYPKEFITCIKGCSNNNNMYLCSITFGTNLGEYGPFGDTLSGTVKQFSVKLGENRQFFGFYGADNGFVGSIGVYLKPNTTLDLVKKERIN